MVEPISRETFQRYRANFTRLVVVPKVPIVGSRTVSLPASPAKGDKQRPPSPAKRRRSNSRKKKKGDKPAACCVLVPRVNPEATREGEPSCVARPGFAAAARKGEPNSSDHWEHKAKEGILIRHHVAPRSDGFVPTKDSPVPVSRLNAKAVVVMNLDPEDWKSGKLDSGLGVFIIASIISRTGRVLCALKCKIASSKIQNTQT